MTRFPSANDGVRLWRRPLVACSIVLIVATGLGTYIAVGLAVHAVIDEPYRLRRPDQVFVVHTYDTSARQEMGTAGGLLNDLREGPFQCIAAMARTIRTIQLDFPVQFDGSAVTRGFACVVDTPLLVGRYPNWEARPRELLVSERVWRRHLGGDASVAGRSVQLDGEAAVIVGVVGDAAAYPDGTDVWEPLELSALDSSQHGRGPYEVIGRLTSHSGTEAQAFLNRVSGQLAAEHSATNDHLTLRLSGLDQGEGILYTRSLQLFRLAAIAWLAIAVANLLLLILLDCDRRRAELSIRAACGASSRRLAAFTVRLYVPTVLFASGLAYIFGILVLTAVSAGAADYLPRLRFARFDLETLGASVAAVCLVAGIACGLPALAVSRARLALGNARLGESASTVGGYYRRTLMALELALMIMLAISVWVFGGALYRAETIPIGFNPRGLAVAEIVPSGRKYDESGRKRMAGELLYQLQQSRAISEAVVTSNIPFGRLARRVLVRTSERTAPVLASLYGISRGYFSAVGIPLNGSDFASSLTASADAIVISQTIADQLFPGAQPIGQRVTLGNTRRPSTYRVVGVAGDVRESLSARTFQLYRPIWHLSRFPGSFDLVVRSDRRVSVDQIIRSTLARIDPMQAVLFMRPLEAAHARRLQPSRFRATVVIVLTAAAFLVALLGIVTIGMQETQERRYETAVRLALGARNIDVLRATGMRFGAWAIVGACAGSIGGWLAGRVASAEFVAIAAPTLLMTTLSAAILTLVALAALIWSSQRTGVIAPYDLLRS